MKQDISEGAYGVKYEPFKMKNVRKLPFVGDVHCVKEQWPSSQEDWANLWEHNQLPIRLSKIIYGVNRQEKAFNYFSMHFKPSQNSDGEEHSASCEIVASKYDDCNDHTELRIFQRKLIHTVKIKQRNTPEGVSKICGLWFLAEDGADLAKVDLCEGFGQWRVQTLAKHEYIIGYHYCEASEDENSCQEEFIEVSEKIDPQQKTLDNFINPKSRTN